MHGRVGPHAAGIAALLVVTLLWGTTFAVIKGAVTHVAPLHLTLARFAIAGSIFLPWVVRSRHAWGAGLELGGWLFLGYATQAVGLRYTTASRSAFITAASVVLVPLLITAAGRRVPRSVSVAALVALAGVGLLSWDGSPPNVGDAWTLVTAAAYAVYVVRLEAHALAVDTRRLTAVQLWSVAMFAALGVLAGRAVGGPSAVGAPPAIPPSAWAAVAYLALAATAVTTWLQAAGQRRVTAPEAALIYTLEPLWAALFAYWWLGESLGRRGLAGAALVVAAMLLSQWPIRRP
ncbi:EamA family transporter [bacterium]|nr:MAG: EamA family transporter [bacterium]